MRDEFYMVLFSNSSKKIYPKNSPTHFNTLLPQNPCLQGNWAVAICEIQIPLTFQHILSAKNEGAICVEKCYANDMDRGASVFGRGESSCIAPGVYTSIETLLEEINGAECVKNHLCFKRLCGGFIELSRICGDECSEYNHALKLSKKIRRIIGFQNSNLGNINILDKIIGDRPANLAAGLPNLLMVYSDICEPYVTGDYQTRLLRIVPLSLHDYKYGAVEIMNFSVPMYIPLLSTSFDSIEIDIRDQQGNPIPFDDSTLTVTLHFKRTDYVV